MPLPIFIAKFNANLNADYSRSGAPLTGTASGTVTTSGGKAVLQSGAAARIDFSNHNIAFGNIVSIKCKVTPNYSGSPATNQHFVYTGSSTLGDSGRCEILHLTNGNVCLNAHDSNTGTSTLPFGAWSPTAGVEYEILVEMNFTTGVHKIFIDGIVKGTGAATTAVRHFGGGIFRIGAGDSELDVPNFSIRDLIMYDATQYTANYTPGYTITLPNADTWPTEAQTKTGVTFYQSDVLKTGTYDGSDRWTSPAAGDFRGADLKSNSLVTNLVGTLAVPSLANTKIGVAGDGGVGTYDGSDRWTDLIASKVKTGEAYKANSTSNNRTGTYAATERYTDVPLAKVEQGYGFAYNSLINNRIGTLDTVSPLEFGEDDDLSFMFTDFGVPVTWTDADDEDHETIGLLDIPSEIDGGNILSNEYRLTLKTTDIATITRNLAIVVNGEAYTIREMPRRIDDGKLVTMELSKT